MAEAAGAAPIAASESDEDKVATKKEFEEKMAAERQAQNLGDNPNAVPEQRPIASQTVDDPHSKIYKDLRDAGDPRANEEAMGPDAYRRAASKEQAKKAAKEETQVVRLYPGARAYIDNPGEPDDGRAVAVNRVAGWASETDALKDASGDPGIKNTAIPSEYECMSRDGRAELLIVSAEHLRTPAQQQDWGKTPIH